MKPFSYATLLLLIALTLGSCKKIPVIYSTESLLSFKMDGVLQEAKGIKNVFAIYLDEEKVMQIMGNVNGDEERQISISLNEFHGVGVYDAQVDLLVLYNVPGIDESIISTEGKIKITEYVEGKSIKGEFEFKGTRFFITTDPNAPASEILNFTEGKLASKVTVHYGPIDMH